MNLGDLFKQVFSTLEKSQISNILDFVPKGVEFGKWFYEEAQKNPAFNKLLQEFNLDPIVITNKFETVYTYTLIKYAREHETEKDKYKPILNLLGKHDIKRHFWSAYKQDTPFKFWREVEKFLTQEQQTELKSEIKKTHLQLEYVLKEFGEIFINYAKLVKEEENQFTIENGSYPKWNLEFINRDFKALIQKKTELFSGRDFVFQEFEEFKHNNKNGYFILIGSAGTGKTVIAAKYVKDYKCICHFNDLAQLDNSPEKFLKNIHKSLIERYSLQNSEEDTLESVLQKASEELEKNEQLVIVIDALDEVEQSSRGNTFSLPSYPPNGVFFFLTRRPFNNEDKKVKEFPFLVSATNTELNLVEYEKENRDDVEKYINEYLKIDQDKHENKIRIWLKKQKIFESEFREELAKKSENNFMYLSYILPAIANGKYDDLNMKDLPEGLKAYYNQQWGRMKMEDKHQEIEIFVLFILIHNKISPTVKLICEIIRKKEEFKNIQESRIEKILTNWSGYLKIEEEEKRYKIYHASFVDFLNERKELDRNEEIFQEIIEIMNQWTYRNQEIINAIESS
ncbi:MAG: NB-ARC domain-containing protein [Crocosphaera sp.]|nr:NB-ARC domain-containing protein [Crocosphaera sp.]